MESEKLPFLSYEPGGTLQGGLEMTQHSQHHTWDPWPGWSTICAGNDSSFTLWFTGLPGTGKTTLADLVKQSLVARGYKVEIIDAQTLSHWLKHELHIDEDMCEDRSHTPGYDAFITYICMLLARNGIITITSSVSPYQEARTHAREQISKFIEVYLYCSAIQRNTRLQQQKRTSSIEEHLYQIPTAAEISLDTSLKSAERSALCIIDYLERYSYITPLWEEMEPEEEQLAQIKARLRALGYLE